MSAEISNYICDMVFDRSDDRTFDPSEVVDVKRPGDVKTTALADYYMPAPIMTTLARY